MKGQSLACVSPQQGRSKRLEHGYGWVDATFEGTKCVHQRQMAEALLDWLGQKQEGKTFLIVVTDSVQPSQSPVSSQRSSAGE